MYQGIQFALVDRAILGTRDKERGKRDREQLTVN